MPTPGRRLSEAKGHYVGPDGYPKPNATTGAEYVHFFYDKNGFEGLILYKDRLGNPKQGLDKAFGKFNLWNSEGRGLYQISLDAAGKPMIDEAGNCGALTYFDSDGDVTFSVSFDTEGNLVDWKDKGIAARAYSRDQYGNSASLSYYNADGSPGLNEDGFHRVHKIFDDRGHVVEYRYFGRNDEPVSMKEGHHIWRGIVRQGRESHRVRLLRQRVRSDHHRLRLSQSRLLVRRTRPANKDRLLRHGRKQDVAQGWLSYRYDRI